MRDISWKIYVIWMIKNSLASNYHQVGVANISNIYIYHIVDIWLDADGWLASETINQKDGYWKYDAHVHTSKYHS